MVVAEDGTAYVGNFGFDFEGGDSVETTTGLVIVRPDGSVTADDHQLLFPNGAVITPSDRTLIVGETFGGQYTAFTIDHDGSLTEPRIWASVEGTAPDGCTLDEEEGVWFSDAVGQQIVRVIGSGDIDDPSTVRLGDAEQHLRLHARWRRRPHALRPHRGRCESGRRGGHGDRSDLLDPRRSRPRRTAVTPRCGWV